MIEMNPRVSRSSALASKATGFPIAKIAARLAVGYALEEIDNDITRKTPASFEPTIDYVVVKWPRFAFEKFPGAGRRAAHLDAVGRRGDGDRAHLQAGVREGDALARAGRDPPASPDDLLERLESPSHDRYELLFEAIRRGHSEAELCERTGIDPWFMAEIAALARGEDPGRARALVQVGRHLRRRVRGRDALLLLGLGAPGGPRGAPRRRARVVILGSGPNRIGQGIEFDYCCVHAAMTVRDSGRDAVMINCNPETVSTDYDTSDRLYFEPLDAGGRAGRDRARAAGGRDRPVRRPDSAQAGAGLAEAGVPLLGTPVESIHLAEDRPSFGALLDELGLKGPPYATAGSPEQALEVAAGVGYPLLVRPSYVLGGRAMEICYSRDGLADYQQDANSTK